MSTVVVQAGQCGNQLGFEALHTLYDNVAPTDDLSADQALELSAFFRNSSAGKPVARAVLVDTEPKVVEGVVARASRGEWNYNARGCVVQQSGAGNNWAMGYNMCSGEFLEGVMDRVRAEIEACDGNDSMNRELDCGDHDG